LCQYHFRHENTRLEEKYKFKWIVGDWMRPELLIGIKKLGEFPSFDFWRWRDAFRTFSWRDLSTSATIFSKNLSSKEVNYV